MINTDILSQKYREKAIDKQNKRLLITSFENSLQKEDLTLKPNCGGFGRIRHFRRETSAGWPSNPLPIDPAISKLNLKKTDLLKAQIFQNAVCNWRCWYCYVPYSHLSGNGKYSTLLSADELIDLYLRESDRPRVIDLTGGQPDLIPEWVVWTMEELIKKNFK